jgi:ABC-type phosphate transport system permease subunit
VQHQPPFIVRIVEPPPAPHVTLLDVVLGSLTLTALLVLVAVVLGLLLAVVLVTWRRHHPPELDRMPPVSPSFQDSAHPPSPTQ